MANVVTRDFTIRATVKERGSKKMKQVDMTVNAESAQAARLKFVYAANEKGWVIKNCYIVRQGGGDVKEGGVTGYGDT